MGCCGQKRRAWSQEINKSSKETETIDSENTKEHKPKVFEYIGKRSLKLKGTITGNIYYFRFQGYKIEVPYEDAFAMMAETELKVHAKIDNRSEK